MTLVGFKIHIKPDHRQILTDAVDYKQITVDYQIMLNDYFFL